MSAAIADALDVEDWRPIAEWPGYQASSEGRVRSHVLHAEGRVMKLRLNPNNLYWTAGPTRDGKQKWVPVHVLVALAFHGSRPPGAEVRHLDGTRDNNRPENLAWGSHAENMQDMVAHGKHLEACRTRAAETTHCKEGHPFNEANSMTSRNGKRTTRRCRVCYCAAMVRSFERQLAAALEAVA